MASDNPDDIDVHRELVANVLGRVRTLLPAHVLSYDAARQAATVQIAVRNYVADPATGELTSELPPPIGNVPVVWPSSGRQALTMPLQANDPVTLIIAERSTDEYRSTGAKDCTPQDPRRFDLSDAVCIPGWQPFSAVLPAGAYHATDLVLWSGTGGIRLGDSTASDYIALASLVGSQLDALKSAINGWTPVPNDGGAALKVALTTLFLTWPGSVASAKVKSL